MQEPKGPIYLDNEPVGTLLDAVPFRGTDMVPGETFHKETAIGPLEYTVWFEPDRPRLWYERFRERWEHHGAICVHWPSPRRITGRIAVIEIADRPFEGNDRECPVKLRMWNCEVTALAPASL